MQHVAPWQSAVSSSGSELRLCWVADADEEFDTQATSLEDEAAVGRLIVAGSRKRTSFSPVSRYWYDMIPERVETEKEFHIALHALSPDSKHVNDEVFTYVCDTFGPQYSTELDIARRLLAMYNAEVEEIPSREIAFEAVREALVTTGRFPATQHIEEFIADMHEEFSMADASSERMFRNNEEMFKLVYDEFESVGEIFLPTSERELKV